MRDIMAIVRLNKVNNTKDALIDAGFPAFTCRKVTGRGKEPSNSTNIAESKMIPKRLFLLTVKDEEVDRVVKLLMDVNSTGKQGDGKIFVCPANCSYRIMDGVMDIS